MWRTAAAVVILTALLGVPTLSTGTTPAHACTPPGPEFDPVASSEVIIEGRILGYDVLPESPEFGIASIVLQMDVERVWKGLTGSSIRIVDNEALVRYPNETRWGPGGLCNAFFEDPSGSYAILGVSQIGEGMYRIGGFSVFYLDEDASGERYDAAVAFLAGRQSGIILPSTGTGLAGSTPTHHLDAVIAIVGAALLAASFAIRFGAKRQP